MAEPKLARSSRSSNHIWLIGYPTETLTGARLPSGNDVIRNFMHYHHSQKLTVSESAKHVYDQLMPSWIKSGLPTRQKHHIIKKITDLHSEHVRLARNKIRNNQTDQDNQNSFMERLSKLFDISHANAQQLIKNVEDKQFLKLQQESRSGSIGSVDKKLAAKEKRTTERKERQQNFAKRMMATKTQGQQPALPRNDAESEPKDDSEAELLRMPSTSSSSTVESEDSLIEFGPSGAGLKRRKTIISSKVSAVLDRTNTSVRKSTIILASVANEAGCSTSSAVLSKSTVHRHRKKYRQEIAENIKENYVPSKSIVHWDGKLLPDVTGETVEVDRLPVLLSSLADGTTKLLGVPKLTSGTGEVEAAAITEQLQSWECTQHVIGMCFDTTTSNTGRLSGACTLVENNLGKNLLWMACRHHMFEILLADVFTKCFGPSSGPNIQIFNRFRQKWFDLNHHIPQETPTPLVPVKDSLKTFISQQLDIQHTREDYKEFLILAGIMVGLEIKSSIRKPGALHRARWMAKAVYSLKIELLFNGNETVFPLTMRELQGLQRFNRFVIQVYIQSWFTSRLTSDAPYNDILLIQRLNQYDDAELCAVGIKMMKRHSWYLSPELATLVLFSSHLSVEQKSDLLKTMINERGPHLITSRILPQNISDLVISRSFFQTADIDDSFLEVPVLDWPNTESYRIAATFIQNLCCVNDCAERGVSLIQEFNESTKVEVQKQFLLQVVEKHRKEFVKCNRPELVNM